MTARRISAVVVLAVSVVALWPDPAFAERRGGRRVAGRRVVVAAYYRPVYYGAYFYDPWYAYPFGHYPHYAYGPYPDDILGSLRLHVSPRQTEVFVDGYYAGVVDDFDGVFQRLRLEVGEHEVQLYLPGYRAMSQRLYVQPGRTIDIRHAMEPLRSGDVEEVRPAAILPPAERRAPRESDRDSTEESTDRSFGAIALRVQPADAEVLIDNERWEGPAIGEALIVQVAPGRHRIEVRKEGHRTYMSEVSVRPGQSTPLNISLPQR